MGRLRLRGPMWEGRKGGEGEGKGGGKEEGRNEGEVGRENKRKGRKGIGEINVINVDDKISLVSFL